jgi:cell division protease FtsH
METKFILPKTKLEKIKRVEETKIILKKEFIGLDNIIDKIIQLVTPWYITPEIIKRPVVISLWGMTGTGKSSVVKRLVELLGLSSKTIFLDCGEECNDGNSSVADKVSDFLNASDEDYSTENSDSNDMVFVFDEFQYARTLSESGEELSKPNLRPIWSIVDSGIININENNYTIGSFLGFFEDIKPLAKEYPGIKLDKLTVNDPDDVKIVLETLGFFYYQRSVPGLMESGCSKYSYDNYVDMDKEDSDNPYRPLKIIDDSYVRTIIKRVNSVEKKLDGKAIIEEMFKLKTLGELIDWIEEKKPQIVAPKIINCTKSLVFIVGNLDEAFKVGGDLNPDFDADIFYDETSKVTINDIKTSLKDRFRAEQIARFGNTIIKYPTLKREHFEHIIKNEITRIFTDFEKENNISVNVTQDIHNLLYFEGVYPVQGVRPVFTTIGSILTPLLSDILIYREESKNPIVNVEIGVIEPEKGYKKSRKNIYLKFNDGKIIEKTIELTLGNLRDPQNRKTRYITSVHEAGHAIVMSALTGNLPTSIVSVASDKGGFCTTYDPEKTGEISSRRDVKFEVMISMAGYLAEHIIFKEDEDRTLLGSSSDITEAWETLSDAAFNNGYFEPFRYSNYSVQGNNDGVPDGIDSKMYIDEKLEREFRALKNDTINILNSNINLLKETALCLGEKGSIGANEFLNIIKKSEGNQLTEEYLEKTKKENSVNWYLEKLKERAD